MNDDKMQVGEYGAILRTVMSYNPDYNRRKLSMENFVLDLSGSWQLSGRKECGCPPGIFTDAEFTIPATVPGNIELDLWQNGLINDPYIKLHAKDLRKFEFYEWIYQLEFEYDGFERDLELVCDGVDCCATIFCNAQKIGSSENALIPHRFHLPGNILRKGINSLAVHIASANNVFRKYPMNANVISAYPFNYEVSRIRKPAHCWGWDITPRLALGGIFRQIKLQEVPAFRIADSALQLASLQENRARMLYSYKIETPEYDIEDLFLSVDGQCEDSHWHGEAAVWSAQGVVIIEIENPRLWWPRHYGEANLYEVKASLKRRSSGEVLAEKNFTTGIRKIELKADAVWTDSPDPDFQFIVNNVPVRIFGCNHVPVDALHSKDIERTAKLLDMACELDCNMLRIWGGGIYESDEFYERCDREGIMLWHDFMFGCAVYPNDEEFLQRIRIEAECVVKRLRHHPSIALWAGDNECDAATFNWGIPQNPNCNLLTRNVLFEVCRQQDPGRAYLPSSPWFSPAAVERAHDKSVPDPMLQASEQHLWGPRDYFKSDFYRNTHASFISEIGYHGCPSAASIRKFISPERVWPYKNNVEWDFHSSNPYLPDDLGLNYRTELMAKQIMEMFGRIPDQLEDFTIASQICQAEAKKYFIELVRSRRKCSGLLWWNLCDCWPQFSDAVVDYYWTKKLAYYYIKRLQQPVLLQVLEPDSWQQKVVVCNDSNLLQQGSYQIKDADTDTVFAEGKFSLPPGDLKVLASAKVCTTQKRMLLIKWQLADGTAGCNHALCGNPQFDFDQYRNWLPKIAELDNSFQAGNIG